MRYLINSILIIILIIVWGIFYKRNIKNKDISKINKILIVLFIVSFNLLSLYIFNLSSKKKYFTDFKTIEISLNLNNIDKLLVDNKDNYKELMKKDSVKVASKLLLKHRFNYNPKSKNIIKISFSDSISYENQKKIYLIKLFLFYSVNNEDRELKTYLIIKNNKITYKKIISIYENTLNELLNSIFYEKELENKKPEEIVSILTHKFNLPDIYYVHLFNYLLKLESPPNLSDKVLIRFLNNPATFSEATGYAILTNHCAVINKIIDKSLLFNQSALETLLSIIIQSKCKSVEGYLGVLKSSRNINISNMADDFLKQYIENSQKEFIYKNGKRIEEK